MKKRLRTVIAPLVIFIVSTASDRALADPAKVVAQIKVDEGFVEQGLHWTSEGPGFELRWRTVQLEGKIGICGAVHYPNIRSRSQSKRVMKKAFIDYDGQKIMRDLSFFTVVEEKADLDSAPANCAKSPVDAPREWTVFLHWDPGHARF